MRTLLRNLGFRNLWFSQLGLALGDAIMQMGLLEMFRAYGFDPRVETAKLFFALSLPGVLIGPISMAYLDRWKRQNVLVICDALRAVTVVGIAVWLIPKINQGTVTQGLFFIYSLVFVIGMITTFYIPARYSFVPTLVGTGKLIQANTVFTTSLTIANVGGRAVGGLVAERFGIEWAILANALAYLISVGLIWRIQIPIKTTPSPTPMERSKEMNDLRSGLVYLRDHPTAMPLVICSGMFAFLGGTFVVVIVGFALETLALKTSELGYLIAASVAGAAGGVTLIGSGKLWTKSDWLPAAQLVIAGILLVLLHWTVNAWVAAVILMLLGTIIATALIPIDAKLQEQIEDKRRGSVFSARGIITSITMLCAFWLQFASEKFRQTPPPQLLLWLGMASLVSAVITSLMFRSKQKP